MKLFIFEPYSWSYCGGAIGIVANTYEDAVDTIVEESRKKAIQKTKGTGVPEGRTFEEHIEFITHYKKKYFSDSADYFDKIDGGLSDQWLLTHTFKVPEDEERRVVFNNWNYA